MHAVTGATDVGCLALWDPAAIDVDSALHVERDVLIDHYNRLAADKRLAWIEPGVDGEYLLHAYVEEMPPESLQPHLTGMFVREAFEAPSGKLWFAGGEYVSRSTNPVGDYAAMGSCFAVRPGIYRVTVWGIQNDDPSVELPSIVVAMQRVGGR
jgi:hypothetical protein